MSTVSTPAAPASSAGPTEVQVPQPGGNSASEQHSTSERSEVGAAASSQQKQSTQKTHDDDPEWDFGDGRKAKRSEVRKRIGEISKGAQKANESAKQYKARIEAMSATLQKFGLDPEALERSPENAFEQAAQAYLAKKLEEATLEPTEREKRALKAENERLKQEAEERAEQERTLRHNEQVAANADAIAGHFATALKESGLPVNAKSVWLMASLLQGARRSGKQVGLSDLARMTDQHIRGDLRHYLPKGDVAALKSFLGEDWSEWKEAIRKDLLAEHESKFSPKQQQPTRPEPKPEIRTSNPNGYWSLDDLRKAEAKRRR